MASNLSLASVCSPQERNAIGRCNGTMNTHARLRGLHFLCGGVDAADERLCRVHATAHKKYGFVHGAECR